MTNEGSLLGPKAVEEIKKLVREQNRRMRNEQPTRARWQGRRGGTGGTTTGGTVCPCGTTYARGSITSLDPEQGGEHANEYQGTIPFAALTPVDFTVAYSSGASWTDTGVLVATCVSGNHTVTITITVCESGASICGQKHPQAKMSIVTDLNECDAEDVCPQEAIDLMYLCDEWMPLGTSRFFLKYPQTPAGIVTDCVICISPVPPDTCTDCPAAEFNVTFEAPYPLAGTYTLSAVDVASSDMAGSCKPAFGGGCTAWPASDAWATADQFWESGLISAGVNFYHNIIAWHNCNTGTVGIAILTRNNVPTPDEYGGYTEITSFDVGACVKCVTAAVSMTPVSGVPIGPFDGTVWATEGVAP